MTKRAKQTIESLAPEKPSRNPKKTFNQGPTQSFFDFTISGAETTFKEQNKKHDPSEPMPAVVLTYREITYNQLVANTSDSFAEYIVKGQASNKEVKIYEYNAFVKTISDYYKTTMVEDLELYIRLKTILSSENPESSYMKEDLDIINESFKSQKDKIKALSLLKDDIEGEAHKFYSQGLKIQGDYMLIDVKFYDKTTREYGEVIKNLTPSKNVPALKNLQRKIRDFKMRSKYKKAFDKLDKEKKAKQLENTVDVVGVDPTAGVV